MVSMTYVIIMLLMVSYVVHLRSDSRSSEFMETHQGYIYIYSIWALTQENLSSGCGNNKGAEQPVHLCRLISTFVIRLLESIISKVATHEIF